MTTEWHDALLDYSSWMVAAGTSYTTLRIYLCYLKRLADESGSSPLDLTTDDLVRFLGSRTWRPATRKSARGAVRSYCRWVQETERREDNPARNLRPVRVPANLPRPCPDDVLERALSRAIPRDRLMLMLGAYEGMRRAEIAVAHSRDVMGEVIRVHGKGGKDRDVPLHPVVAEAITSRPRGYLFPGLVDGHMSPDRVGHIVADLLGGGWTCHTLRHRMLTRAYLADRDPRAIQQIAGHSRLETVMTYTRVPDGALRRAVMAAGPVPAA